MPLATSEVGKVQNDQGIQGDVANVEQDDIVVDPVIPAEDDSVFGHWLKPRS